MMDILVYWAIVYSRFTGQFVEPTLFDGTEWEGFTPQMKYALIDAYKALLK